MLKTLSWAPVGSMRSSSKTNARLVAAAAPTTLLHRALIGKSVSIRWLSVLFLYFLLFIPAFAQASAAIEEGQRLFRANCVFCHGLQGKSGGGGVDLLQGKFKRPSSDADITGYIRNGIPGTAMDKVEVTDEQAQDIVRFMRASAGSQFTNDLNGDPVRGKVAFEGKGGCRNCHAIRGEGSHFGPDLTDIGATRKPAELERSIVVPDAEIAPQNRLVKLVKRDGETVVGRRLNQDTFTIQIIDEKGHLQTLERSELRDVQVVLKSPMPPAKSALTDQEISDVVAYLTSLKGSSEETKRSHAGDAKE